MNTTDDGYEGWTNRETWAVNLHLSNDEGLYDAVREIRERSNWNDHAGYAAEDVQRFAEALEGYVTELLDPDYWTNYIGAEMPQGIDMMRTEVGSLWRVNWTELAESWLAE